MYLSRLERSVLFPHTRGIRLRGSVRRLKQSTVNLRLGGHLAEYWVPNQKRDIFVAPWRMPVRHGSKSTDRLAGEQAVVSWGDTARKN